MIVIVIILWGIVGIQYLGNINGRDESRIIEAFHETEFKNGESHIGAYGKYEKGYLTPSNREELLKSLASELGIKINYDLTNKYEKNYEEICLEKQTKNVETKIRLITITGEKEKSENVVDLEQYLLVEISLYNSLEYAIPYKKKLEEIYNIYEIKAVPTINLKASYFGELNLEKRNKVADTFLESIDAVIVSEHRSDTLYTIYGYTNLIKESTLNKNKKINVNIAMNYNEEKNMTFLYLSTPIITEDY